MKTSLGKVSKILPHPEWLVISLPWAIRINSWESTPTSRQASGTRTFVTLELEGVKAVLSKWRQNTWNLPAGPNNKGKTEAQAFFSLSHLATLFYVRPLLANVRRVNSYWFLNCVYASTDFVMAKHIIQWMIVFDKQIQSKELTFPRHFYQHIPENEAFCWVPRDKITHWKGWSGLSAGVW